MSNDLTFSQAVKISMIIFGLGKAAKNIKWGDAELFEKGDLTKLTRAHMMKIHLIARSEQNVRGNQTILL